MPTNRFYVVEKSSGILGAASPTIRDAIRCLAPGRVIYGPMSPDSFCNRSTRGKPLDYLAIMHELAAELADSAFTLMCQREFSAVYLAGRYEYRPDCQGHIWRALQVADAESMPDDCRPVSPSRISPAWTRDQIRDWILATLRREPLGFIYDLHADGGGQVQSAAKDYSLAACSV